MPIDRYRVTALHPVAVLSNPHSPNLCAAPRFSPTRFILPSLLPKSFRNLIASRLWGIKRYTLGIAHGQTQIARNSLDNRRRRCRGIIDLPLDDVLPGC
jgi:hypothetical protein